MKFRLLIRNASEIVQVCDKNEPYKIQEEMNQVVVVRDASMVISEDGKIYYIGKHEQLTKLPWYSTAEFLNIIEAQGYSIIPGLVDGHTHPIWTGDRVHEFEMKLQGATYMDIHKAGGGIGFTVEHTRNSSEEELFKSLIERLDRMVNLGTTLVEAKTGYGLNADTEIKLLKVLHQVSKKHPINLSITYLGAHSIPKGSSLSEATEDILNVQIPLILKLRNENQISVNNIDVFHEKGVFEYEETKRILQEGKVAGFSINFHGDELNYMGSGELGAELGATAISHLEKVSDAGIEAMARSKVFATLLPTTAYILKLETPPARKLIEKGVPVCLGSDFNPNAHCMSMPFVMNLACRLMGMTLNEALVASTINAAGSLNLSSSHGSLEVGKQANFILFRQKDWRHIIYEMVDPPIDAVYIDGIQVTNRK